ncbi:MAG: 3-keto-disaccharide hydrolase [Sediminibacterium sp.]|jgi:hypothetical protein|nr:DUF1080 domain-containing protein [Sediminibacterium sp.]MBX9781319.1 DUF1080 domain-containing protein [Chitinophagaceae bacterium]
MQFIFVAIYWLGSLFGNTTQQKKGGWVPLFDGKTTKGWHTYGKTTIGSGWTVEDGTLHLDPSKKDGGDIVSDESFGNFHLRLEWKIAKNGNSGIIFFVQDNPEKYPYVWYTGPEMQVLDNDGHPDGKIKKHRAGNLYDLIEGKEGAVKPVGEWNLVEIIANNGKLDFFLNGENVVNTTYGDAEWKKLIAGSKFKDKPDFGRFFSGHIALQDHGDNVWYRNIMIKKL